MRHSVVLLLEANEEGMDVLDLVLEHVDQALDRLLFFDQIIAKSGSINDSKNRVGNVAQKAANVVTSLFCHTRLIAVQAEDLEATVVEPVAVVVLVPPHEDVGQAGFADTYVRVDLEVRK